MCRILASREDLEAAGREQRSKANAERKIGGFFELPAARDGHRCRRRRGLHRESRRSGGWGVRVAGMLARGSGSTAQMSSHKPALRLNTRISAVLSPCLLAYNAGH